MKPHVFMSQWTFSHEINQLAKSSMYQPLTIHMDLTYLVATKCVS
jgi:hypothetical protein